MFDKLNNMAPFMDSPSKTYGVREYARTKRISPATASTWLKALEKERLITYRKERMLDLYGANIDDQAYRDLKVYYNIRKLRESGLIHELSVHYHHKTIILFGSASNGYDREDSDYDLVVFAYAKKDFPKQEYFEKLLGKPLQIFVVKKLSDLRNEHLMNSVINGIVLEGELLWN